LEKAIYAYGQIFNGGFEQLAHNTGGQWKSYAKALRNALRIFIGTGSKLIKIVDEAVNLRATQTGYLDDEFYKQRAEMARFIKQATAERERRKK